MEQAVTNKSNFEQHIKEISASKKFSYDTETTGLRAFQGDNLFLSTFSTATKDYLFNWNFYADLDPEYILDDRHKKALRELFADHRHYIFMHNAKFDMHISKNDGIKMSGTIHCTQAIGRVVKNDLPAYSLDALSKLYLGAEKDSKVKDYIKENKLYGELPNGEKKPLYFSVPHQIIFPYAMKDTRLTYDLGVDQLKRIATWDEKHDFGESKRLTNVLENEILLTKTLFHVEQEGVKIDRKFCNDQAEVETKKYEGAKKTYEEISGMEFKDSNKNHSEAFTKLGLPFARTEKGNPSFKDDSLAKLSSPLAQSIRDYRGSYKLVNSYYKNFIDFADSDGLLHTNFMQSGTKTGRISARQPALQTIPKADEDATPEELLLQPPIRRCFIPNDPDYCFFMPDFDQMEYKFFMDYAQEIAVIEQILGGVDVHTATATLMGVNRKAAKTINFMLLYGGGIAKLAQALGIREWDAKKLKSKYFRSLSNVQRLVKGIQDTAERRGFLVNYLGRVYDFSNGGLHKTANYIVQGSTADIVKIGMNRLFNYLEGMKSKILLQVHDEIIFKIHRSELHICPDLVKIMADVYIYKKLPLTCGAEYSWDNMNDKIEGYPIAT